MKSGGHDVPLPANAVAIVGMAGRFPGAGSVDEFWRNLVAGVESVTFFTDEELGASGVPTEDLSNPDYVKARGLLVAPELFDPAFFGLSQREAELMDPQHRLFLETCWHALEHAAVAPEVFTGSIGVWGGMSTGMTNNTYLLSNLHGAGVLQPEDQLSAMLGNENDYLTTRVSYKLNLRGPSVNVQSACSTSLVAVVQACQALLTWQCDAALAGGVSVSYPQREGYIFQEGGIGSPDGHCRPFDASAQGTVFSNGVGVVVLRRLEDAIADSQTIYAVIRGAATNNDGAAKVSFAAPSVDGQAEVVATAQAVADVSPDTIDYVEAHGTGTPLGDPIEVSALTKAFRAGGATGTGYCALGSVKSNFGHLDSAAGVAGLIKACLAIYHRQLPPTLHFATPNPACAFDTSPFYVHADARPWPIRSHPRRAGVSSFGIGGTNAHVVLEEAPQLAPRTIPQPPSDLIVLSARTADALDAMSHQVANQLEREHDLLLADVAHTLRLGRQSLPHRRILVCRDRDDARVALRDLDPRRVLTGRTEFGSRSVAFLFAGGGTQYVAMGQGLLGHAPVFEATLEECLTRARSSRDLRRALFPEGDDTTRAAAWLEQPSWGLPALFAVEYALARQWMAWGVQPDALLGHSMGEYTAACLAGVMSVDDAMRLVALRGRLFETLAPGEMLGVPLAEPDVTPHLGAALSIAAVNAASSCVVSGPPDALASFERVLAGDGVECRRLHIAVAAHSAMVEPILGEFEEFVSSLPLGPPRIPVVSNVTGTWLTADQARSPRYWARHLRQTVRFADGLAALFAEPNRVLLEVGPGQTLAGFARQHPDRADSHVIQTTLRHPKDATPDLPVLQLALGRLWLSGVPIDWAAFGEGHQARRVALPLYPFERRRCLVEPVGRAAVPVLAATDARPVHQAIPMTMPPPEVPASPAPAAPARPRAERIAERLSELLQKLSGLSAGEIDPRASFLEMGFDSLFLTQASLRFKNEFKVRVTFRQLFEEAPTIEALAAYIDGKMPADAFPDPTAHVAAAAVAPAGGTAAAPAGGVAIGPVAGSPLERVINDQLRLMAEQLRLLGGAPIAIGQPGTQPVPPSPAATSLAAGPEESGPAAPGDNVPQFGPFRGIDRSSQGLTPHQQQHLDALIERYTRKTRGSKALTASQRSRLADPRAVGGFRKLWKEMVYQIATTRSEGSRMWDVDGNEYLDVTSGFGVNLFGYAVPFITEAVQQQLSDGIELGTLSPMAKEAADLLCEITGMERATFANTGSEAVAGAIRAVRTATGRDWIAVFDDEYHGIAEEVLVKSVGPRGRTRSAPAAPGIPDHLVDHVIVLHYDDPASLDILRERADEIAGVIIEPVQNRHPDFRPLEMIHAVRRVTAEAGIPLIFDEMITGFRLHPRGAQGYFGIDVDVACYGKIISGGLPIAAIAGKAEYLDAFDGGLWQFGDDSFPEGGVTFFGGTFTRNPLSLAAALAALRHLKSVGQDAYDALNAKSDRFADAINTLARRHGAAMRLEHCGSVCNLIFTDDNPLTRLVYYYMRENGIHIWDRPFFISFAHTEADLARVVDAFGQALAEMTEAHFLGGPSPEGPGSGTAIVPFTDAQTELWLAEQMSPSASASYNEVVALEVEGHLDLETLERAVEALVARHESLRFTVNADPPGFRPETARPVGVTHHDLTHLSGADLTKACDDLIRAHNRDPFDLATGPALRVSVIRRDASHDVLVLAVHHLMCDGWSFGTLLRDLGALYVSAASGRPAPLSPAFQPQAYQALLANRDADEMHETEAYWLSRFETLPDPLDLPTDRPRPAVAAHRGGRVGVHLDPALTSALRSFASAHHTTTFTTLLAAFEVLVSRLSGQADFVVGVPMAGQSLLEEDGLVAHCTNFLPVRARVETDATFASLVAADTRRALDLSDHQSFTYLTLLRALKLPRQAARDPLVAVSFTVEPSFADPMFGGLPSRVLTVPRATSKRDLHVNVMDTPQGLLVEVDYDGDLFDEATIRGWVDVYSHLLRVFTADPTVVVASAPLIAAAEHLRVVREFNATASDYPAGPAWHRLAEGWAARSPSAPAVTCGDETVTWRDLNTGANQLARELVERGVRRGDYVAVMLNRSVAYVTAMLACHKAGAAFVLLDPSHPAARLMALVEDAGVAAIVTTEATAERMPFDDATCVRVDADATAVARHADTNLDVDPSDDDPAYVIYTSGSTGRPKGVVVEHRQMMHYVRAMQDVLGVGDGASFGFVSSVAADLGLTSLLVPLATGGLVHAFTNECALDPVAFNNYTAVHSLDVLKITPSHLSALLGRDELQSVAPARCLVIAGEPLPNALVAALRRRDSRCRIINSYGPTETTVGAVTHEVPADSSGGDRSRTPIGRPMPNVRAYVLDAARSPLPVYVQGELYIAGPGVARGYLRRPELDERAFLADPFADSPGQRMYRTGDRARWTAEGQLEFLGRFDHQVKIRGYRFELGEIEAILRTHPAVDDAVASLVTGPVGDVQLLAHVVGEQVEPVGLRQFLLERLPEPLVPTCIVSVQALPLNANGKVDRAALATLPDRRVGAPSDHVETPTERTLARLWAELVGVEQVATDDDFFLIGGHSLLAIRLVHDVQETFGIRLAPVTLLAHPVLRDLAAVIDRLVAAVPQTLPSAAAGEVRRLPAPSVPSRQSPLESSPMVAPQPEKDPLLVQIAKGGSGAPFFWVHGVGGEVFSYMRVSRHLAEHRPVYGFAADWTVAFDESERRIDAIAAAYVSELRRIRPHGPYHLGGFCSAGTLVLEMVRQLEEAGETVGAFAILDFGVLPEEGAASGLRKAWAFMRNLPRWIQEDAVPSGAGELVGRVRSKMRRLFGSGNRANGNGHHVDIRDATGMWRFPDSQVEMLTLHHRVIHGYAPRPCDGRVTLFLPRTAPLFGPWPDGHDPGWSQLARGGVEVVSVAGSHSTMLTDPFAEGLAAQLEACVERAEGREGILEARSEPKKPLGLATSA